MGSVGLHKWWRTEGCKSRCSLCSLLYRSGQGAIHSGNRFPRQVCTVKEKLIECTSSTYDRETQQVPVFSRIASALDKHSMYFCTTHLASSWGVRGHRQPYSPSTTGAGRGAPGGCPYGFAKGASMPLTSSSSSQPALPDLPFARLLPFKARPFRCLAGLWRPLALGVPKASVCV